MLYPSLIRPCPEIDLLNSGSPDCCCWAYRSRRVGKSRVGPRMARCKAREEPAKWGREGTATLKHVSKQIASGKAKVFISNVSLQHKFKLSIYYQVINTWWLWSIPLESIRYTFGYHPSDINLVTINPISIWLQLIECQPGYNHSKINLVTINPLSIWLESISGQTVRNRWFRWTSANVEYLIFISDVINERKK